MKKRALQFNVIFRSEPEGGFTAIVPALPGCISYGGDLKEAKNMILDAISGYVLSLKKHGEPIPADDAESFVGLVRLPEGHAKIYA